jgi:hypothetical protein
MTTLRNLVLRSIALALLLACACATVKAQEDASRVVEVYLFTVRSISLPGLSSATILDPEIAGVSAIGDTLRFTGTQRGETVAIAHVDGKPVSLIVRVVLKPSEAIAPRLANGQIEQGIGTFGSDAQVAHVNGRTSATLLDSVFWRQQVGERQFGMSMSADHSTLPGQYAFNLRTGNINLRTSRFELNVLDFNVNLAGASTADRVPSFSIADTMQLRGGEISLVRGKNQFSIYAGATVPYYFLSLAASRDVAGTSIRRALSDKFSVFEATTFLRISASGSTKRHSAFLQQGGFHYVPSPHWSIEGVGGISNSGGLVRGDVNYSTPRYSAFASALHSSPDYPLNQLQSLFAGTASIRAGVTSQLTRRVGGSFYYEHTSSGSGLVAVARATSNYFSPSLTLNFDRNHSATVNYTRSSSEGGFQAASQSSNRYDISLRSVFHERIMNSAQVQLGSIQDPLQTSSQSRLSLSDTVSFRVRAASMQVSFSHSRTDPSLVQRLNQELSFLSPQLQQLFLQDPTAFVTSDLPPEVRTLLESQHPVSTAIGLTAQVPITRKLNFNPNLSFDRDTLGRQGNWTSFFGYGLTYEVTSSLQLRSSLNSVWMANGSRTALERTTVLSFGLVKSFHGSPAQALTRRGGRVIQGRVYRDENINGVWDKGERGLAGAQVQLDGTETAVTDDEGVYRFAGVSNDVHRVSLNPAQFSDPVRMTTRGEVDITPNAHGAPSAEFGIINFARLMGTVFNDLRLLGKPQPDSPGVGNLRLVLRQGDQEVSSIMVPPNGHFEEDNIPPGDYELTVDANSIPANFATRVTSLPVHVAPVSTVMVNIPIQALRSISGHVYLKVARKPGGKGPEVDMVPLAGVQLSAGASVGTTASDGAFILRNLPAGELMVALMTVKPLAEGLKLPSGQVHMPAEPVEVQNATIVLSNPALVPYVTAVKH